LPDGTIRQLALSALKAEPISVPAIVALARLYNQQGREDAARLLMNDALPLSRHNSPVLLRLIVDSLKLKQYDQAIEYLSAFYTVSYRNRPRAMEMLAILADDPAIRRSGPRWYGSWPASPAGLAIS
jgi:Tfp pilus assembly protein PilF